MPHLSLSGRIDCSVDDGPGAIPAKRLVGISVSSLIIDTDCFRSRDISGKREGVIELTLGGQKSLFTFNGKGILEICCDSQIAYLGRNPGPLSVAIRIIEFDRKARRAFERGSEVAELAARAADAFAAPFVENGLNATSALMSLLAKLTRDDDEIVAFTVVNGPLTNGGGISLAVGEEVSPILRLQLATRDFGKRETFRMLGVRVCRPWIEFGSDRIRERHQASTGRGYRQRTFTIDKWLVEHKALKSFAVAAGSGRHRAGITTRMQGMEDIFHWQTWELFRVAAARAADRYIVPLSLSMSLNSDTELIGPAIDLLRAGMELGAEADAELATASKVMRKTGRGFTDLVSDLGSGELPLVQFDGALLLLPEGVKARNGIAGGTRELARHGDGLWQADITCEFRKWRKSPLGELGFTVEVVAV